MVGTDIESRTNSAPTFKAQEFSAMIEGYNDTYIEYYVEATDTRGNSSRSLIQYVWVGANTSTGGNGGNGGGNAGNTRVTIIPENPTSEDTLTILVSDANQNAMLHWGVNNQGSTWITPNEVYRPDGTIVFNGSGPAVETPFNFDTDSSLLSLKIKWIWACCRNPI